MLTEPVKKSMPEKGPPPLVWRYASNPVAIGSKPTMMPPTPRTVSPSAGLQVMAGTLWMRKIMPVESGHVAFGYCAAEAMPAMLRSAATARNRVNNLRMV